ncbi:hypothetical protein [Winogradskyella psychrotolerans]|uniref:hypothetical protein n=1 Tax=Winogradskyella psychrotolerans TaxID=1344585 RepID=UPI001C07ED8A|nr:hypothetical protein [Winogradskyella psychrotolerans]MBU2927101.1 hypothetical protein [Winogradskyella psychrotolerans]
MKSKKKAILLGLTIFTSLFASMFLAIIAFQDIPKYNKPYLFTFVISAVGIFIGYFIWKKLKPTILKYSQKKNNEQNLSVFIIITIVGLLLFTINELNILSAYKTNCDLYTIVYKYRKESRFRQPEVNTLVVDIVSKNETIVCKYDFWNEKRIGSQINLCFYEAILVFNYIEINE